MKSFSALIISTLVLCWCSCTFAQAQDASTKVIELLEKDVARLQEENDNLKMENKELKKQLETLESRLNKKGNSKEKEGEGEATDLFSVGTTWSGTRYYTQKGADPSKPQDWQLIITERKGRSFKGDVKFVAIFTDKKPVSFQVSGTAPKEDHGQVNFRSVQRGAFDQQYKGLLSDGQITLEFSGTGNKGGPAQGNGTLKQ